MGLLNTTITASPGIDSNVITELTTDSGVEVRKVVTEWAKVVTPGVSLYSAQYQIVKRTTVVSQWYPFNFIDANGVGQNIPSTELNARTTTTEIITGIPAPVSTGQLWVQGGYWTNTYAALTQAEILREFYYWDPFTCLLSRSTVWREQYYAPLNSGGGVAYGDGSIRDATASFREISQDQTWWSSDGIGHPAFFRWHQATVGTETYGQVDQSSQGVASIADIAALPEIPTRGSRLIPQVSEEVITIEYDATAASGYQRRKEAPGLLPYPENEKELNAIAMRRIRRACSDTLDIPHNLIPFLRVGDHVAVTNHARNLVGVSAYVVAIKRTMNVLNGAARQVTTVKIPPSWI